MAYWTISEQSETSFSVILAFLTNQDPYTEINEFERISFPGHRDIVMSEQAKVITGDSDHACLECGASRSCAFALKHICTCGSCSLPGILSKAFVWG